MKIIITILLLITFSGTNVYGQDTFAKLIDLFDGLQDVGVNFNVLEDELVISSAHFCNTSTGVDNCTGISRFNFTGENLDATLLENYNSIVNGNLTFIKDNVVYLLGVDSKNDRKSIPILNFDLSTTESSRRNLLMNESRNYLTNNILEFNNSIYTSGVFLDTGLNKNMSFIFKWNEDFTELNGDWTFFVENRVRIGDLIPTLDSNLVFVAYASTGAGAGSSEDGMRIIEIDTLGNILHDFKLGTIFNRDYNLSMDLEGNLYTDFDVAFRHEIAKINSELDSILWITELPQNPYAYYGESFQVDEIINTRNGDILVCGSVEYLHLSQELALSSFITRIDPNGEVLWHKILSNSNREENVFNRKFRNSFLHQVKELPSGHIAGVGQVQHLVDQNILVDLWLLILDGNGCIEGFDCDHGIYVLNDMESFALTDVLNSTSSASRSPSIITINPNPAIDVISIDTNLPSSAVYKIYNLHGQLIQNGVAEKTLDISDLFEGVYVLQILDDSQIYNVAKFIKL